MKDNSYMTEGNITKALWKFTLPMVAGGILQQLYSLTDALILGNFIGDTAVASVSAASAVLNICFFIIVGIMTGASIQLSHMFGAKEYDRIQRLATTGIIFLSIATMLASAVIMAVRFPLFDLMNTPPEIIQTSASYLSVAAPGLVFSLLYNLYGGMLRAVGNSKKPLEALIIASVLNVILDLVFVAVFGMGIAGVALATVIAQGLSAVYLIIFTNKNLPFFRIKLKHEMFDYGIFKETITLSLPKMLQSGANSVGSMLLQVINNYFGVYVVAAISTAYRIDSLAITPIMYISSAVSIFAGQNMGAKKADRARKGMKTGAIMSGVFALAVTIVFVVAGGYLLEVFGLSQESVDIGWR
ncbi:MAG: MATE family efflux transporter, partial [Clostridia bacterium]|nr:MATE family efflux transporter [Clostridia bacterium]